MTTALTDTTGSFNLNFIELTAFIHQDRSAKVKEASFNHIKTGDNSMLAQLREDAKNQHIIVGLIMIAALLVLLIIRLKFKNKRKNIKMFINLYLGRFLNPCIGIMGVILLIFLFFVSGVINSMYDNMDKSICQAYYIKEIIIEGKTNESWSGLTPISDNLHYLNEDFMVVFEQMNTTYDF